MLHGLLTLYYSVPASTWQVLGAALGLSSLLQALKHYFFKKLSPHAIMSITTVLAFVASAVQYWMGAAKANPAILGQHTAVLLGVMTLAYRYVVGPAYGLAMDAKTYRLTQVDTRPVNSVSTQIAVTVPTEVTEASF